MFLEELTRMIARVDFRVIIGLICAVALAYWLLLPRPQMNVQENVKLEVSDAEKAESEESDSKNGGQGKVPHKDSSKKSKTEEEDDSYSKEKMISMEEALASSQERIKELQRLLNVKELDLENIQKVVVTNAKPKKEFNEKEKKESDEDKAKLKLKPFNGHRLVHLDLKGAAPKTHYLKDLLTFIKSQGATGLLLEYEVMYPYEGELSILRCKDAYTKDQIIELMQMAKELDLIVMPLVQTFGHLEFVLKHKKFAHLRETEMVANSLCPLKNGSLELVKSLVKDILRLHPDSAWIHLGGDEVWNLKSCDKCKESSKTGADLYLQHMIPLFEFVKEETSGKVTPVIWDDMMRSWKVKELKSVAAHAEPMVWAYVPNLEDYHKFPQGMWERFNEAFPKIWIASSFKGATKPVTNYVPIKHHIENHLSWMRITSQLSAKSKFIGIALTGWSRFDHYGPLCELLPAGVPSLAFCLTVLKMGYFDKDLQEKVSKQLGFKKTLPTDIQNFKSYEIQDGKFPGSDVFRIVSEYEKAYGWFMSGNVREEGWARLYNVKANHLGYYQLNYTVNAANACTDMLEKLKPKTINVLSKYYSDRIVKEWIEDKILATIEEAALMKKHVERIMKKASAE